MSDRTYSDQELDAALASIAAPGRLRQAEEVVLRTAPSLQRLLAGALADGGWYDAGHSQAVRQAAGTEDPLAREREVQTLLAEETRLGMLVGVAVGFELARELDRLDVEHESANDGDRAPSLIPETPNHGDQAPSLIPETPNHGDQAPSLIPNTPNQED